MNVDLLNRLEQYTFPLTANALWVVFFIALIAFFIMSVVLMYHWQKFGLGSKRIFAGEILYLIGGIFIIGIALVSLNAIA